MMHYLLILLIGYLLGCSNMAVYLGASCTRPRTHEAGRIRRKASGYITC